VEGRDIFTRIPHRSKIVTVSIGILCMNFTRRHFIKNSLFLGSSLLLSPVSLHAGPKKESQWIPAYEKLEMEGKLLQRVKQAYAIFENCQLCPRKCGVNRQKGGKGFCRAPVKPVVFSTHPHFARKPLGERIRTLLQHNLRCVFARTGLFLTRAEERKSEMKTWQKGCFTFRN
jgi:hypothetical protein